MKLPELLSPAGSYEKMLAAFRYGADAVYLAGEDFGMRSAAKNFSLDEIRRAVRYARAAGKRVYVTVNILPHSDEYPALRRFLRALAKEPPDALIISDLGVIEAARELIPACQAMLEQWTADNSERLDESIVYEHEAIECAFQNYEALGLEGGVLYADGQLLGFTFGEMTSQDTFDTHVEKAAADVNGAYPMVCRELARMLRERHPELRYINREDDMGLESLRASKQSYKPLYLLKKYTAEWNDDGLNPS